MSTVKKVPQRQCIGCGEMKNKRELIRVLKGTDDVDFHRRDWKKKRTRRIYLPIHGML